MSEARALHPVPGFTSTSRAFEDEFDYLYRALRRYGVQPSDAEDLVQDVFVVMWRRWADYQTDRPLRPWLAGIAVHLAQKHLRRRGREVPDADLELQDESPHPEDRVGATYARALVLRALSRLPEKYRLAIVLHELDELSMNEIAELLSIPLATAYTRVRRARLQFATAVREVEAQPLHERARNDEAAAFTPAALLQFERAGAEAPPERRQRALARARALALLPPGELPDPAGESRGAPRAWPLVGAAAVLVIGAALLVPLARRAPAPAARPTASAPRAWPRPLPPPPIAPAAAFNPAPPSPRQAPAPDAHLALDRGVAGYWRFDDPRGSHVARDLSPAGRDCTLHSLDPAGAWVQGAFGGGMRFSPGTWLECALPAQTVNGGLELSIAAWTKRTKLRGIHGAIAARQLGNENKDYFLFSFAGPQLEFRSDVAHGTQRWPIPDPADRWVHVAVSLRRDGHARLFVDGVAIGEHPMGQTGGAVDKPLIIGASINGKQVVQSFHGELDELVLYDRALSDDEVVALAHGAQPYSRE